MCWLGCLCSCCHLAHALAFTPQAILQDRLTVVVIVIVVIVLSSQKHVLDTGQAVDIVKSIRQGMRDGRHGHDGGENASGPHGVRLKSSTTNK